jgi:hypothetical protein
MESFVAVIICATSQYPNKLADKVQYLLENNGYTRQNSTHKVNLDFVLLHSEKQSEKKDGVPTEEEQGSQKMVKIFAHYITIEVFQRALAVAARPADRDDIND